ncbi:MULTISPECIES: HD domain-containing protein [Nocardiopsidaceae]|uniref:HD domain-containing protein n=2 Tax=Nocardiopsidaceae TaxID=83676 RepID=A0ABY6YMZ2_9ACTN|nr:HD domain-containing protein [Streptomonospora nanhaiensis]WAE73406.1 HD domain-containing protein [Streptomonospora nanhaiensis]
MDVIAVPDEAARLLADVGAPPRLVAHGDLVHGAAVALLAWLADRHPGLPVDAGAVRFGAAVHDIGKTGHPGELTGPGRLHEAAGERLLLSRGVPARLAGFCATHGDWSAEGRTLEDLLVSLSDKIWKGARVEGLELLVTRRLAEAAELPAWEVFASLDDVLRELADGADARLAHQARHAVAPPGTGG